MREWRWQMTQVNLVVGYLATPGGADALALAVRFARTLAAEVEVLPRVHGSAVFERG